MTDNLPTPAAPDPAIESTQGAADMVTSVDARCSAQEQMLAAGLEILGSCDKLSKMSILMQNKDMTHFCSLFRYM